MLHKKPSHTRITRSSSYTMSLLNRPAHSKATLCDSSFSFASSSVWNSIPNDVRCALSLSSFKSRLKKYLFRSVYKDWTFFKLLYICICACLAFLVIALMCLLKKRKKVTLINHDCLPILMLLYIMLWIMLAC